MRRVSVVRGKAVPIDRANVDTDQIIPARHLKRIERTGYGPFAFEAWRKDPDFLLNDPRYSEAVILVTRDNFGCGSSREHAVWALDGLGLEAVIAESFADIFKNNCFQGGMLTVELPKADIDHLMAVVIADPATEIVVELAAQTVSITGSDWSRDFDIDPYRKYRLERGLDDISMTLEYVADIEAFEAAHTYSVPSTAPAGSAD